MGAIERQPKAKQIDFLGRLCGLVPEASLFDWLTGQSSDGRSQARPLGPKARCLLMCALAKQLSELAGGDAAAVKLEWLSQLWLVFDSEEIGDDTATKFTNQVLGFIEQSRVDPGLATQLRQLTQQVRTTLRLLSKR